MAPPHNHSHESQTDREISAWVDRKAAMWTKVWTIGSAIITAVFLAGVGYANLKGTVDGHTQTLAHLEKKTDTLEVGFKDVEVKVDALLLVQGISPQQVLKSAGLPPAADPAAKPQ
jgi:hypothetical protein